MRKPLSKALTELVNEQILSQDKANEIRAYYAHKNDQGPNRLMIVFGILGALLVGLGIILILAHNWDELSRSVKTILAFAPLITGQIACGYTLWKKKESISWREGSSTFLFFAVGASISLISQIYNISGSMSGFLLTWMLLCVPLVYVLRSSASAIFYLGGITWYACEVGYWGYPNEIPVLYGLLLLVIIPHYYLLYKHRGGSNFTKFHHWLVPLSTIIVLGTATKDHESWMFLAYMSLFGLLYIIGSARHFKEYSAMHNGPAIWGSLGTTFLLILLSFQDVWREIGSDTQALLPESPFVPEFLMATLLSLGAIGLFFILQNRRLLWEPSPATWIFIIFIPVFLLGNSSPVAATIIMNLLGLTFGLYNIRKGAREHHLGILNYGLIIITILICCRFFDTDISFVLRGLIFVAMGTGFFVANYIMLKNKKSSTINI